MVTLVFQVALCSSVVAACALALVQDWSDRS